MSQSALIAEQTKYRQALLKALQPYESHVAFVERLAYWDSPIHTVGAAIVFTIALNMFVNLVSKTTAVTFAAIILGTLLLAWRISQTVRISVAQGAPTRGSLDKIVYTIVAVRFGAERFAHHTLQRLQSPESTRYLIKLGGFLLVVAFIGSFLHLSTLVWLAVLGLLVLPGATQRGLHQKVWVVAEPHFNANWPKVAPFITPAATIAQNELRNLLALDLATPITTSVPAATEKSTTSSSSSESSPSTTPASVSTSTQTGGSEPENSEDEKDWVMPAKTE